MCVCVGLGVELSRKRPVLLVLGKRDGGFRPLLSKRRVSRSQTLRLARQLWPAAEVFWRRPGWLHCLLRLLCSRLVDGQAPAGGGQGSAPVCEFFSRPHERTFLAVAHGWGAEAERVLEVPRDLRRNGAYKVR